MDTVMVISPGVLPRIMGRGRRKGDGPNLKLLGKLEVDGNLLFDVPRKKMLSLRQSAVSCGIVIQVREQPNLEGKPTGVYAIQRKK